MFYTKIVFISCILEKKFHTQSLKDSYIVHDHIEASFLFLLQKDFYIAPENIDAFCFFLLQKDFGTFYVVLFWNFFLFFFIIAICHFHIYKKNFKNIFNFFHPNFLHQNFLHQKFLYQNFYIVNNILRNLFFLKQPISILLKTLEDNNFHLF